MAAVAAVAAVGGCGSDDSSTPRDERAVFLVYEKTGGVAGVDQELRCHRDGQCELIDSVTPGTEPQAFLSADELGRLRETFEDAGFEGLDSSYPAPQPGSDYFSYRIAYEGKTVTTETTGVPPELEPVIAELDRLVTRVRTGTPL
jgi:hypothetical protein